MIDDTEDGAEDERTIELSAIQAIYPELTFDLSNPFSAHIEVPVEPQKPLPLQFANLPDGSPLNDLSGAVATLDLHNGDNSATPTVRQDTGIPSTENQLLDIHYLSYLPPLQLKLSLPDEYPANSPPSFEVRCSWLPSAKTKELEEEGTHLWEELGREPVIFAYIDSLSRAADDAFGLLSGNRTTLEMSADLKVSLLDFDLKAKRTKFEQETFECGICLEPKKGSVCHRLSLCSHVFCVECLQDFYNTCITEGEIGNVKCMAPNCGDDSHLSVKENESATPGQKRKKKKKRTVEPSELLQIPLEQETVQRYIKLKRKKRLESDRTTVYCPRQWCQGPARSKKSCNSEEDLESDDDDAPKGPAEPQSYDPNEPEKLPPPSERLAICEDCSFAFCKVCKVSWHGEYFICFPRSQFELTAEERASEDYMKLHTQACPTCDARAQKTHGCNHMICFKCDTHFCYLCGAYLQRDNPYQHYNSKDKGCYMRLWELEEGDGGEVGQGFAGGMGDGMALVEDGDVWEELQAPPAPMAPVRPADPGPLPPGRRQQGQRNRAAQPAVGGGRGGGGGGGRRQDPALQRFLQMVQDDEEDEWDSDDMEDEAEELGDRWIG